MAVSFSHTIYLYNRKFDWCLIVHPIWLVWHTYISDPLVHNIPDAPTKRYFFYKKITQKLTVKRAKDRPQMFALHGKSDGRNKSQWNLYCLKHGFSRLKHFPDQINTKCKYQWRTSRLLLQPSFPLSRSLRLTYFRQSFLLHCCRSEWAWGERARQLSNQQKLEGLAITFSYQTQGIVVMRKWEIQDAQWYVWNARTVLWYLFLLYWVLIPLYSVLMSLYAVLSSLYSVLIPLYSVLMSLYAVLSSLYSVLIPLYSVLPSLY